MTMTRTDFGKHSLIDYINCDPETIKFLSSVRECGATLIDSQFHQFEPFGVSGVVLIAESHFSLHTWPENGFAAADIFTCGEMDPDVAIDIIKRDFKFVGQRLAPGGYIALDAVGIDEVVQNPGARTERWDAYYHSIRSAGFETVVPYISTLEHENEAAWTILEEEFEISRENPAEWRQMQRIVANYVESMQQGFIMALREVWKPGVDYWELGIPLHVINEERFGLAFPDIQLAALTPPRSIRSCAPPCRCSGSRTSARPGGELVNVTFNDRGNVSRTVAGLERRGYLKRQPDPVDGRGGRVFLTSEGRRVLTKVGARVPRARAKVYKGLNNLDFANFKRVCETIERNILEGDF